MQVQSGPSNRQLKYSGSIKTHHTAHWYCEWPTREDWRGFVHLMFTPYPHMLQQTHSVPKAICCLKTLGSDQFWGGRGLEDMFPQAQFRDKFSTGQRFCGAPAVASFMSASSSSCLHQLIAESQKSMLGLENRLSLFKSFKKGGLELVQSR